jgi:hypothetical protein
MSLAGIAEGGPIPPFVSEISEAQKEELRGAAVALRG